MTKQAEQQYLANIGEQGREHALAKPFSDAGCADNLVAIGIIFSLLPAPPARLLDLGCGPGWTSTFFALRGYDVVGQDIAADMLDLARENQRRHAASSLSFVLGDYEGMTFDSEFDCAVFFDSLHHCDDERAALRAVYKALKPGGVLITHEPGEGHSVNPHSIQAMELYGVNERDMPPSLIIEAGRAVGFRQTKILPMPASLHAIFYPGGERGRLRPLRRFRIFRPLLALLLLFYKAETRGSIVILTK